MPEVSIVLTPVHWLFLTGVIAIFLTMIREKIPPLSAFSFCS